MDRVQWWCWGVWSFTWPACSLCLAVLMLFSLPSNLRTVMDPSVRFHSMDALIDQHLFMECMIPMRIPKLFSISRGVKHVTTKQG